MGYYSRLQKAYEGALRLPLNKCSKYVIISDCHRGTGNANDNYMKNQMLHCAALSHYYRLGFTYIELGDGDELWENRSMKQITDIHDNVFAYLRLFCNRNRLYMLYGNHDINKRLLGIPIYEGIVLENTAGPGAKHLFLTHGHQASLLNSTLWPLARFLVRYLWKPLERLGLQDPTSAAKNNTAKEKTERRLRHFAKRKNLTLIAGHTHRPVLSAQDPYYYNCGSCVHPYSITCLEIEQLQIRLVKWTLTARADLTLQVTRETLNGPIAISPQFSVIPPAKR